MKLLYMQHARMHTQLFGFTLTIRKCYLLYPGS